MSTIDSVYDDFDDSVRKLLESSQETVVSLQDRIEFLADEVDFR